MLLALLLPLVGAVGIAVVCRNGANARETVTLATADALVWTVWKLLPVVTRVADQLPFLAEVLPGIDIAFSVEPLGMLFAALASSLWIVNSIYSIGYMRGNKEANQTRFYAFFAIALAAAIGIAFADNLFTLFLFYEILTLSTYPLVAHKGDAKTMRSARVYLGVLLATSIGLLLPAIIWTYHVAGTVISLRAAFSRQARGPADRPARGCLCSVWARPPSCRCIAGCPRRWWRRRRSARCCMPSRSSRRACSRSLKVVVYIFGIDFLFAETGASELAGDMPPR